MCLHSIWNRTGPHTTFHFNVIEYEISVGTICEVEYKCFHVKVYPFLQVRFHCDTLNSIGYGNQSVLLSIFSFCMNWCNSRDGEFSAITLFASNWSKKLCFFCITLSLGLNAYILKAMWVSTLPSFHSYSVDNSFQKEYWNLELDAFRLIQKFGKENTWHSY